jgi:hypothetical protein
VQGVESHWSIFSHPGRSALLQRSASLLGTIDLTLWRISNERVFCSGFHVIDGYGRLLYEGLQ